MKVTKSISISLAVIIGTLIVALNFSASETRYKCNGRLYIGIQKIDYDPVVFIKLEKYRWWARFWNDSDGLLWIEAPSQTLVHFDDVKKVSEQFQIYSRNTVNGQNEMKGYFSILSNRLDIKDPRLWFSGTCEAIDE